jgi:hypothetical protein
VLYTADSQFTALCEVEALFLDDAGELRGVTRNPDLILTLECSLLSVFKGVQISGTIGFLTM